MSGIAHVYATQMFQGLPIANAVSNFNIAPAGEMMSMQHSFVPDEIMSTATPVQKRDVPMITADQAVLMFAQQSGLSVADKLTATPGVEGGMVVSGASFAMQPIQATQKYYQMADCLVHTWDLSVNMNNAWQNAFVNSASGEVVGVSNWTSDAAAPVASPVAAAPTAATSTAPAAPAASAATAPAVVAPAAAPVAVAPAQAATPPAAAAAPVAAPGGILPATYNVIPIGKTDIAQNNGQTALTSPWNLQASPNGWQNVGGTTPTIDLTGNNVIAQSNPGNVKDAAALVKLTRPVNANLQFAFQFDAAQAPTLPANRDAATTNMFYVANSMHDIFYNYGFTEAAGNFQTSNNGKGGAANDAVIANSQDGSGTNNANFASPPDGQPGIMRMFTFTTTTPNRDGALDNGVISHEMTHGLSNRLTGGPANANCLQTLEAGGMGEGWSDMFALMTSLPDANTRTNDVVTGAYVTNTAKGVRMFPYSTNIVTNPHMFSDLTKLNEVHNIGEVWTTMLNEVMWNMIDVAGGKTPAAQIVSSAGAGTGNTDLMLLLIQGMKMQPCNPTFIQARDAINAAEQVMFAGKYQCAIANGFAKRGMGVNAASTGVAGTGTFTNNQDLPAGCAKTF
ncbi:ammonium transporter [Podochytrium sp. JEL0797]|nr:ammonium transporter [Podochytrium sp. JEL0797]